MFIPAKYGIIMYYRAYIGVLIHGLLDPERDKTQKHLLHLRAWPFRRRPELLALLDRSPRRKRCLTDSSGQVGFTIEAQSRHQMQTLRNTTHDRMTAWPHEIRHAPGMAYGLSLQQLSASSKPQWLRKLSKSRLKRRWHDWWLWDGGCPCTASSLHACPVTSDF